MKKPSRTTCILALIGCVQALAVTVQQIDAHIAERDRAANAERIKESFEYTADVHRMTGLPPTTRWSK